MVALRLLICLALSATAAAPAQAKTWPPRPGQTAVDPHRYQAEQHRLEMELLRTRADQREIFARRLELETRVNRQRIQAAGRLEPDQPPAVRAAPYAWQDRALGQSAAERRQAAASQLDQIDAWLARPRD